MLRSGPILPDRPTTARAAADPPGAEPDGLQALPGWRTPPAPDGRALADCSLVVPTYARPSEVMALVDALAALPDPPGEVVVVDGSPDDRTAAPLARWARAQRAAFTLVYAASAPGLTRQRNVGIDLSTRRYVFFLDDDCIPAPGYFRSMRRVFEADRAGRIGAAGGTISNGPTQLKLRWRLRFLLRLIPGREPGRYYATATSAPRIGVPSAGGTYPVDMVPGGVAAYRREALERDRFSLFFDGYAQGEDLEMSRRLSRSWELRWCVDARVVHNHAPGGRPPGFAHGRMSVRNRWFIWRRHSPEPPRRECGRFWADVAFCTLYDLAVALPRPSRWPQLAYTAGALRGILDCLVAPPRYEEPPAKREYTLAAEPLPGREP